MNERPEGRTERSGHDYTPRLSGVLWHFVKLCDFPGGGYDARRFRESRADFWILEPFGPAAPYRGTKGTCFRRNDRFARRKLAGHAPDLNNRAMTAAAPVLVLEKASRLLAGRRVVCDLDLALAKGEVLGLLGVNGAGKSTTLRMIAGVLAPSAGRVRAGRRGPRRASRARAAAHRLPAGNRTAARRAHGDRIPCLLRAPARARERRARPRPRARSSAAGSVRSAAG